MSKKRLWASAALTAMLTCGAQAFAQTSTDPNATTQDRPAPSNADQPPLVGANSFTKDQARTRIENAGFTQVAELKKDDQGVWRAAALKDGKSVRVALDYKGNVVQAQ